MIKLLKKSKSGTKTDGATSDEPRQSHGIEGRGDSLRDAVLYGVLLSILPFVIGGIFLLLIREPAQKNDLLGRVGESYAAQQAQVVSAAMQQLRQRAQSSAVSPTVQATIADPQTSGLQEAETALRHMFPEATSVHLVLLSDLGTADPGSLESLRNHIEIDLVRRASNGTVSEPETYQLDGKWLTSLAQLAVHPESDARRAVILITLDDETLSSFLRYPGNSPGQFTLEQTVYGVGASRKMDLVSLGSAGDAGTSYADIGGTQWRVSFTPSQATIDTVASRIRPDYDVLGVLLLCSLAGFALAFRRSQSVLVRESGRIAASVEQRTPLTVTIPALVPLAQELRRLTLRRARMKTASPVVTDKEAVGVSTPTLAIVEGKAECGLPPNIFRAYDIRGLADADLDDETVYRIGSAIGTLAGQTAEQTLVIGRDCRSSSARIKAVVEKALLQSGRDVIDIGIVPTPLLYFATAKLDASSGVMITGSHNPAEYNGVKVVLSGQTIAEGAIEEIRTLAESGQFSKGQGRVIQQDIVGDYLDEVVGDIAIAVPLKVVVDAGNGATSHIAPDLMEELGCEVIPLYCELNGEFPNRSPDTSDEASLKDLVREVVSNNADFGVAYDGDGDRLAVVTGSGKILRTDTLMMLFARDVVSRNPGADVVYDVKCSRNLAQLITSLGGRPVLWKTGHALMKQKMLETGALLGGEFSGHIFFGERWFGFDDGMYATGRLAEILSSQHVSLDEFIADLPADLSTPEILIPVPDDEKFVIMQRFVANATFSSGKSNTLDGLRVDFEEGWGLLRASNTSPALTARFEARDEVSLEVIRSQFRNQLAAIDPDLNIPF